MAVSRVIMRQETLQCEPLEGANAATTQSKAGFVTEPVPVQRARLVPSNGLKPGTFVERYALVEVKEDFEGFPAWYAAIVMGFVKQNLIVRVTSILSAAFAVLFLLPIVLIVPLGWIRGHGVEGQGALPKPPGVLSLRPTLQEVLPQSHGRRRRAGRRASGRGGRDRIEREEGRRGGGGQQR
jgi:hypothetical protein